MKFFIKKNATLPKLRFGLDEKFLEDLNITDEMFENCAVTFSMRDYNTNRFKIANTSGELFKSDRGDKYKYYLEFSFNQRHTNKAGIFVGEFVVDFFYSDCANKLKLPQSEPLYVVISDTITNTLVN